MVVVSVFGQGIWNFGHSQYYVCSYMCELSDQSNV